jgi:hypothetical protein
MIRYAGLLFSALILFSCQKEKEERQVAPNEKPALAFTTQEYSKKSALLCEDVCTSVEMNVPVAENIPVVADSINNKVFNTIRSIVYFGEKPSDAKDYEEIMNSFIASYDEMVTKFPDDKMAPWDAQINGGVDYTSGNLINVTLSFATFTGGAHGYEGSRSLLFNAKTGRSLAHTDIFKDVAAFKTFAEKKFREKFKIAPGKPINSTGLMFENETFALPQNIFFKKEGLLLYYNAYEIASYAEQQKELLIPYSEAEQFLKMR